MEMESTVQWTVVTFSAFAVSFVAWRRLFSGGRTNKDLSLVLVRFFIVYESLFFGAMVQAQNRGELYRQSQLSSKQIDEITYYSQISFIVWNFFMPFVMKPFSHSNLLSIVAFVYAVNSVLATFATYKTLVVSGCLSAIANPTAIMCMNDWWMTEEGLIPPEANGQFLFNELRAIVNMCSSLLISPLSTKISSKYGPKSIFTLSPFLFLSSIVMTSYLLHLTKKPEPKTVVTDLKDLRKFLCERGIVYLVLFVDITYAVSHLVFQHKSTMYILSNGDKSLNQYLLAAYCTFDVVGSILMVSFCRFLSFQKWLMILTGIISGLMFGVYFVFENKLAVFVLICLINFFSSCVNGNLIMMRKSYYQPSLKNYILSIIRLPITTISFALSQILKSEVFAELSLFAGILMGASSIGSSLIILIIDSISSKSDQIELLRGENEKDFELNTDDGPDTNEESYNTKNSNTTESYSENIYRESDS